MPLGSPRRGRDWPHQMCKVSFFMPRVLLPRKRSQGHQPQVTAQFHLSRWLVVLLKSESDHRLIRSIILGHSEVSGHESHHTPLRACQHSHVLGGSHNFNSKHAHLLTEQFRISVSSLKNTSPSPESSLPHCSERGNMEAKSMSICTGPSHEAVQGNELVPYVLAWKESRKY